MIRHVVLWKVKDQAMGLGKEALAREMKSRLETLPGRVPGIRFFQVGRQALPAALETESDLVLVSDFDDLAALKAYAEHPEHLKVVDFVKQAAAERRVVDFEVG
jgi:heme-degrading monooxygenase HmoA